MLGKIKSVIRESNLYNKIVFVKNLRGKYFDYKYNVNTTKDVFLDELSIESENIKFGAEYVGTDPKATSQLFEQFNIDHKKFTFIDFGSGKGRVLFIASNYPYKKIIGVEFAIELDEIAKENIKSFQNKNQKCDDIEAICLDATKFELPEEPLVLYLFNPFGEEVLSELLKNVEKSLTVSPREIYIFYIGAFHRHVFDNSEFFEEFDKSDWHILYKTQN